MIRLTCGQRQLRFELTLCRLHPVAICHQVRPGKKSKGLVQKSMTAKRDYIIKLLRRSDFAFRAASPYPSELEIPLSFLAICIHLFSCNHDVVSTFALSAFRGLWDYSARQGHEASSKVTDHSTSST